MNNDSLVYTLNGTVCRVTTERSTTNRLHGSSYNMIYVWPEGAEHGEWMPAAKFRSAARFQDCGHSVARCKCEPV